MRRRQCSVRDEADVLKGAKIELDGKNLDDINPRIHLFIGCIPRVVAPAFTFLSLGSVRSPHILSVSSRVGDFVFIFIHLDKKHRLSYNILFYVSVVSQSPCANS